MRTIVKNLIVATIGATLFTACASESRVVVKDKPTAAVVVRPAPPYAGAVWIGEEWRWKRGRYVYVVPHYVHPRKAHVWVPGHWRNSPRGFVWVKGHWR